MSAEVVKAFSDGVFKGKVVGHVPDLDNNELEDGEMFVIQYEPGKQETVDSQELMSMLVGADDEEEEEEEEESKEEDPDNLQETKVPDSPKIAFDVTIHVESPMKKVFHSEINLS